MEVENFPFKYLGSKVSPRCLLIKDHEELISRIEKKLAGWKRATLNQAGRVTLINSVLNSMPVHLLSSTWTPLTVVDKISRIARNFLWEKGDSTRGLHLIGWDTVTRPKAEGGLAIKDLRLMRFSLMAKKVLHMINNANTPWVRLAIARYGQPHPWYGKKVYKNSSWTWRLLITSLKEIRGGLIKVVSNGHDTNVWQDPWIFCLPIDKWPTYINMNMRLAVTNVSDMISVGNWNFDLISALFCPEITDQILGIVLPICEAKYKWVWKNNPIGLATSKSTYCFMRNPRLEPWVGWKQIWALCVPAKINNFLWKLTWGKLPTRTYLNYIDISHEATCPICNLEAENITHIFTQCSAAKTL